MNPERKTTEDVFVTETDANYVKKSSLKPLIIAFFLFTALAGLGFLITTFVFFELLVLGACTVVLIQALRRDHRVVLRFEGSHLTVKGYTTQGMQTPKDYEVFDMSQSDFIIRQSKAEVDRNYCLLTIKDTVFFQRSEKVQ